MPFGYVPSAIDQLLVKPPFSQPPSLVHLCVRLLSGQPAPYLPRAWPVQLHAAEPSSAPTWTRCSRLTCQVYCRPAGTTQPPPCCGQAQRMAVAEQKPSSPGCWCRVVRNGPAHRRPWLLQQQLPWFLYPCALLS